MLFGRPYKTATVRKIARSYFWDGYLKVKLVTEKEERVERARKWFLALVLKRERVSIAYL